MNIISKTTRGTVRNSSKFEIKLVTYGLVLLFFFLYLLSLNGLSTGSSNQVSVFILSWFGILTFVYIVFTWYKITNQILTPYIIFMLFFFMFNFGQPLMWAFGIHLPNEIGMNSIYPGHGVATHFDIVKTQIYILICAWMLHFGALIAVKNRKKQMITGGLDNRFDNTLSLKVIFKVSLLFAVVSIPLTLWTRYEDLMIAASYGYRALYYSEYARRGASIANFFSSWFFPSLLGLLIGSNFEKKTRRFVIFVLAVFVLLNVASGDRHSWVYKIAAIIWISHITYKPLTKKRILTYMLTGIASIYLLDVIISLRNIGITFDGIIHSFSLTNSSITKVIFEMGQSMNPTLYFHKYGADFWEYGNTYILALGGLITNRFLEYFNIPYGILSRHFGAYLGISWGPGFSIVAEPFMNFGPVFAPLFMIFIGYLISKLLHVEVNEIITQKPLKLLFVASSLDALTRLNRDSVHVPLKNWFYGVVFFCLIIYVLREFTIKKSFR